MNRTRMHRRLKWVWVLLIPPTLLWWTDSITWVVFMSLYANISGHWAAEEAANADD
jgi:hypothetical protein